MQDDLTKMAAASAQEDKFYAPDVQAAALADNNIMDESSEVSDEDEIPVTSGELEIGNLDADAELGQGSEDSYDEESVAGGEDNTVPGD